MRFFSTVTATTTSLLVAGGATGTRQGNVGRSADNWTPGSGVFQQLIDHSNSSLGTFSQSFWWNDEFYAGPGSPVVFYTPGEDDASYFVDYLRNTTLMGRFAEAIGGAVIMLEHRYWGTSSPYTNLTTETLQYLTVENAIADNIYFANNVNLPFDNTGSSHPSKAPWIYSGGSYPGALGAWTAALKPGTFWAYHATSAIVQTIGNFWQYFVPVMEAMPRNCSTDVARVIDHIDSILTTGSEAQKRALKTQFSVSGNTSDGDFAVFLENLGPTQWQQQNMNSGYTPFFMWCDFVENMWPGSNNTAPGVEGVGLAKAIDGYAKWAEFVSDGMIPEFDIVETKSNSSTAGPIDSGDGSQWDWLLCNQPLEFWQTGAPRTIPSIVSRYSSPEYWEKQCSNLFPSEDGYTYGIARGKTPDEFNEWTGGWSASTTRVLWINGQWDPWRESTVSAHSRPGGPAENKTNNPVFVIPSGIHCSDILESNWNSSSELLEIVEAEIAIIQGWVNEFNAQFRNLEADTAASASHYV